MDKQEILTFTNLYIKFQEQCKCVAKILSEYDRDFNESKSNSWELDYADCHSENKFDCCTEIDIITPGWHIDCRSLSFPVELLSATDEQIYEYASSKYKKA